MGILIEMTDGVGLAKWLSMSPEQQAVFLKEADDRKALQLASLKDEEVFFQSLELMRLADLLPKSPHQPPPFGLGRIIL